MDANAKAIVQARQIALNYMRRVGDWSDEKAVSRAIEYMEEIYKLPDDPPRNCDVGTDNEQLRRWKEFCDHYEVDRSPESFARWAQGPYFEEGGEK